MFIAIAYDIVDDKRRNKVFKTLKNYGKRIQYSFFECDISEDNYLELKNKLKAKINEDEDSVKFYFLCASCHNKLESLGKENSIDSAPIII